MKQGDKTHVGRMRLPPKLGGLLGLREWAGIVRKCRHSVAEQHSVSDGRIISVGQCFVRA